MAKLVFDALLTKAELEATVRCLKRRITIAASLIITAEVVALFAILTVR